MSFSGERKDRGRGEKKKYESVNVVFRGTQRHNKTVGEGKREGMQGQKNGDYRSGEGFLFLSTYMYLEKQWIALWIAKKLMK
jgi:hypothetical protein